MGLAKTAAKVTAPRGKTVAEPLPIHPTVQICGRSPAPVEHLRVLELAMPKSGMRYPACWDSAVGGRTRSKIRRTSRPVEPFSEEYQAVTKYFKATVGCNTNVQELTRLQNPGVYYNCYVSQGFNTIMFHGCRSQANENSIIEHGFQVKCCTSGGTGFGTWFAYGAQYSNRGYAFVDPDGIRHLFVSVVSSKHVVLDNATMRVVGQGCAYPLWLLKYQCEPSSKPIPRKAYKTPVPRVFYVVRDGSWVLE